MEPWIWWALLTALLVVVEVLTGTLVLAMIAAGTLAAAVVAGFGGGGALQVVAFVGVSALMLAVVRPVARRHMRTPTALRSGVDALIGADAVVVDEVSSASGTVKIGTDTWTARPYDGDSTYQSGERLMVLKIEGATALVG